MHGVAPGGLGGLRGRAGGGPGVVGQRQVAEVGEQFAAVLAADGLGVELDAPDRQGAVPHAHHDAVLGPGDGLQHVGQPPGGQRVVADHVVRAGQAGEDVGAGVAHRPDPAVHRLRRVDDLAAEQVADALVAEADAEHRQAALQDRAAADAEVPLPVGPAGPGGDHDRVEVLEAELGEVGAVLHHRRRPAVHLAEQLVEVVGERVVVVDQQGSHGALPMTMSSTRQVSLMIRS